MGFPQLEPSTVAQDNKNTMDIANSYRQHPGIKHIDIKHHFIRDRILNIKDIKLEKRPTTDMEADLLAKNLPYPVFSRLREKLGLHLYQSRERVGISDTT